MRRLKPLLFVVAAMMPLSAWAQSFGFAAGDRFPVVTYHGDDGVQHSTAEFKGRWFLLKRGADWCVPCVSERPSLAAFMRAHPEFPVIMLVATSRNSPAGSDPQQQMLRDVEHQRKNGWDTRIVVVQDGRQPGPAELPSPKAFNDVPLTALITPDGVIAAVWNSTHQYQKHWDRRGVAGKPEPQFQEYVEALLLCRGVPLSGVGAGARAVADSLDARCS